MGEAGPVINPGLICQWRFVAEYLALLNCFLVPVLLRLVERLPHVSGIGARSHAMGWNLGAHASKQYIARPCMPRVQISMHVHVHMQCMS